MRLAISALAVFPLAAAPLLAQHGEGGTAPGIMSPNGGLMFWTLLIFVILFFVLKKYAFPPILAAVEARERALEEAIEGAKRDREAAAQLLAEQRVQIEGARVEAQRYIAEGRAAGEQMRNDMLEQTRVQQDELLARARREIDAERARAVADLRREAVDLAIAGAGRVIERNMDDQTNRRLVEDFLSSVSTSAQNGANTGR